MTNTHGTAADTNGLPEPIPGRKVVQLTGAKMTRERKRTQQLMDSLPKGITIGDRKDGRPKPFFVRYGKPRKVESFAAEVDRNDKAENLAAVKEQHGSSLLNYDPAEWKEFQDWKANHKKATLLVRDAVSRYMALRLSEDLKEGTDVFLHIELHLRRLVEAFGDRTIDGGVTTDELRKWFPKIISAKTGQPIGKATIRNHRKDINMFFARAVNEEWARRNPCAMVKPPKLDDEDKTPLEAREIFDLLKFNRDEPVVGRLALELFGGMRASSAERAVKSDIRQADKSLHMPGAMHKSGKPKLRQGHPPVLWEWIAHAPEACWTEISTTNYGAKKSQAFIRARVVNPGNALRHSFASYLLALTKSYEVVGYLMQHRNRETTQGYEGLATEADAKLVMAMTPDAVSVTWEEFLKAHQPTP